MPSWGAGHERRPHGGLAVGSTLLILLAVGALALTFLSVATLPPTAASPVASSAPWSGYGVSPSPGGAPVNGADESQAISFSSVAIPRVIANVSVGSVPYGSAYDPANGYVYVADENSSAVSVLSGTSTVATIPIGGIPAYVTSDPVDGYVYVASFPSGSYGYAEAGNVSVIDGTSVVARLQVGHGPGAMTYDAGNGYVYVPNTNSGTVSVLSGTSAVATVTVGTGPWLPAYDSANGDVYVPNLGENTVSVVSGTSVVGTVSVGSSPATTAVNFATYDGANDYVYVTSCAVNAAGYCASGGDVSILQGTALVTTIPLPASSPEYEISDPVTGYVYVGNYNSSSVSVLSNTSVLSTVSTGAYPYWGAYDPADGYVFISNDVTVSAFSGASVVVTLATGVEASWATYDAANGYVYVSNFGSNDVSVIGTLPAAQYSVTFTQSGLSSGVTWSVTLNGSTRSSAGSSIGFSEPNGTYGFTVGAVTGYTISPASGAVTVSGAPVSSTVTFIPTAVATYAVTFGEAGLPAGTSWNVSLYSSGRSFSANGTGSSIIVLAPNGTYTSVILANTSSFSHTGTTFAGFFTLSEVLGNITVNGGPTGALVRYSSVTFTESGLPAGTVWWVVAETNATNFVTAGAAFFGGADVSQMNGYLPNGVYRFEVCANLTSSSSTNNTCGSLKGYTPSPQSGTFVVNGAPASQPIAFTKNGGSGGGGGLPPILGLPGVEGYVVVGTTVAIAVIAGVLIAVHSYAAAGGVAMAGGAASRRAYRRWQKGKGPPPPGMQPAVPATPAPGAPPPGAPPPAAAPPVTPPSRSPVAHSPPTAVCSACGKPYMGNERFCTSCGRPR